MFIPHFTKVFEKPLYWRYWLAYTLSAIGFELNKKLAERVGANGYVTKPVDHQELLNAIRPFLGNS